MLQVKISLFPEFRMCELKFVGLKTDGSPRGMYLALGTGNSISSFPSFVAGEL